MLEQIQTVTLENGIGLIHKQINSKVAHLAIMVNVGSREEDSSESGVAHCIEHTLFKGTQKRKGIYIIKRVEDIGGDMNAYTTKEETVFHVSFLADYAERMIELFADLFYHALFPEKEVNIEKEVIFEEIRSYMDMPSDLIFDEFENLIFKNHSLGNTILGTQKSVKSLKQNTIKNFYHNYYTNHNLIIASEGPFKFEKIQHIINHYFNEVTLQTKSLNRIPFTTYEPRYLKVKKKIQQAHCMIGNIAYSIRDQRRIPFYFLNNFLGGPGMNSKLNLNLREKKGLAYDVESNYTFYSDCGLFSIYFSTEHARLEACMEEVRKTIHDLQSHQLGILQLSNAKKQIIGQMAISNESNLSDMLGLGRAFLHQIPIETEEDIYAKIEAITASQLLEIANEQLDYNNMSQLIYTK